MRRPRRVTLTPPRSMESFCQDTDRDRRFVVAGDLTEQPAGRDRQRSEHVVCSAAAAWTGRSIAPAGPEILAECRLLGGCDTGDAKATTEPDGCLPAGWSMPSARCGGAETRGEAELLASCAQAVARGRASDLGARTVAFPAISCGIYGYPPELAAPRGDRSGSLHSTPSSTRSGSSSYRTSCAPCSSAPPRSSGRGTGPAPRASSSTRPSSRRRRPRGRRSRRRTSRRRTTRTRTSRTRTTRTRTIQEAERPGRARPRRGVPDRLVAYRCRPARRVEAAVRDEAVEARAFGFGGSEMVAA